MAGKKGMKHYPAEVREKVKAEYEAGGTVKGLSCKYGISRYAIRTWCGLVKGKGILAAPKRRGRPHKRFLAPEKRIKELEREVALLRPFLQAAGRG